MRIFLILFLISVQLFSYDGEDKVKKHFKVPKVKVKTPSLLRKDGFMSDKELKDFIGGIHFKGKHTKVNLFGPTTGGHLIPLVVIGKNKVIDKNKPTVMLVAQQHGDEPMGADVLLGTIKRLARWDLEYLLDDINVVVLPRLNPDGAENGKRHTHRGKDMNSDHTILQTKEALLMKQIFNRYKPDVVLDIHEYIADGHSYSKIIKDGAVPYYDILFLSSTNPNYSERLKNYAYNIVLKDVEKDCKKKGYSTNYYYNPFRKPKGSEPMKLYVASGTAGIARNAYALNGTLSFLIELRGKGIGRENIERRLDSGLSAVESFLISVAKNGRSLNKLVEEEKNRVSETISITWEFLGKKGTLALINTKTGEIEKIKTINYVPQNPKIRLKRPMPTAYILDKNEKTAATILKNHGIKVLVKNKSMDTYVDEYTVYKGRRVKIKTKIKKVKKQIPKGSFVVPVNQKNSNFIGTLLEPEGDSSFVARSVIKIRNKKLPIYRYHGNI
ncbi:M14 family metallocarboxypeptidase [uncultured Cetobacterium sp.]|uniref:M14 family metallopeptidase n=1 Tax=uncultured Cetobacterium sp. TaxID=527638 RepID=UPI002623ADB5|nr:M14 family metallocarboxypeptidase [uncultured Cetobacterium sp.]